MYASPDDARSDLFLAGAVYLFGPLILRILLDIVPLGRIPYVGVVLTVVLPLVTTALVPFLLARYRAEPASMYGLTPSSPRAFGFGLLVGVPVILASLVAAATDEYFGPSLFAVTELLPWTSPLHLAVRLTTWLGLTVLAVYGTVKARDAFRGDPETVRRTLVELARYAGAAALVAGSLLLLPVAFGRAPIASGVELLALPAGLVGAMWLVLRSLSGPSSTTRATLLTPLVLLALGPFTLGLNAVAFLSGIWRAALFGMVGVVVGALQESRRTAWAALGLAVAVAVLTPL